MEDLLQRFTALVSEDSVEEQPEVTNVEADSVELEATETEAEAVESLEGVEDESLETESQDTEEDFLYEISGKEYSASEVESWKDNGLRQSDYTKKTQQLSADRKSWESEKAALQSELQSTINAVRDLAKVKADFEVGDDGLPIYDDDMGKYQRLKAQQDKIDGMLNEASTLTNNEPSTDIIQSEREKLQELIPEWSDAGTRDKDSAMMVKLVEDLGLGDDFSKEYRASMYQLVRLAAVGRNALESGSAIEKQVKKAPKIIKPKQAKQAAKHTKQTEARSRFRKSGGRDEKAGVELFTNFV